MDNNYICLCMDWKQLRKLYVMVKQSLLLRLRIYEEPAVSLGKKFLAAGARLVS